MPTPFRAFRRPLVKIKKNGVNIRKNKEKQRNNPKKTTCTTFLKLFGINA